MSYNNKASSENCVKCDMQEIGHDHAWNYFKLHAKQRIELFKCYIMFFTIFATGIGFMLAHLSDKEDKLLFSIVAIIICIAFFIITNIFRNLDIRNRQLVELSRKSLRKFEELNFINTMEYQIFISDYNSQSDFLKPKHSELFKKIYTIGNYVSAANILLVIANLIVDFYHIKLCFDTAVLYYFH